MLMPHNLKIYFYTPATDMRKSIDTLCILVSEVLKMNPTSGHLFLFRSRDGNKLKALHYETNCFTLWYRRLEKGRFVFPKNAEDAIEMSLEHFNWILKSNQYTRMDTTKPNEVESFY
jgi:transposase